MNEVESVRRDHAVSDSIQFGEQRLTYKLILTEAHEMSASFIGETITVHIPADTGLRWADGDEVGMSSVNDSLSILVEKDFSCLKPREGEDESRLFPNPLK
jgi:hypothetical protein